MLDINGIYIVNLELEVLESQGKICLLPEELSEVFVLNAIEAEIWKLFVSPISISEAYCKFNNENNAVSIEQEDFLSFIKQLIDKNLLLKSGEVS